MTASSRHTIGSTCRPTRPSGAAGRRARTGGVADRRGQVEPLAALAALFAVCVGLSVYAVVLADAGRPTERDLAEPTLAAVDDVVSVGGIVHPSRLDRALASGPSGWRLNVTVAADDARWTAGPSPTVVGDRSSRRVSVRLGPGRVRAGHLRVVVWR